MSVFGFVSCLPRRLTLDLDSPGTHHAIRVSFTVRGVRGKQNGKILMKYDERRAKVFFLSPLNQIYFKLLVEGNHSVLVNTKKKIYWTGDFTCLLTEMWQISLGFNEFRLMVQDGTVPRKKLEKSGLEYRLETDPGSGKPKRLELFNRDISILLKIQSRKTRNGSIEFLDNTATLEKGTLTDVIEGE